MQDDVYMHLQHLRAFVDAVQELAALHAGRERLMGVLRRCMLRTSKANVAAALVPPCFKHTVRLPFDPQHELSYNTLIDVRAPPLLGWCHISHIRSVCQRVCNRRIYTTCFIRFQLGVSCQTLSRRQSSSYIATHIPRQASLRTCALVPHRRRGLGACMHLSTALQQRHGEHLVFCRWWCAT
jgi:hypothetical protein